MPSPLIRGGTLEERLNNMEIVLTRYLKTRPPSSTIIPIKTAILSGYIERYADVRLYVGISSIIDRLELYIDDIEPDENKKKLAFVQLQLLSSDLKGSNHSRQIRVGRNLILLDLSIEAATKLVMSFNRPVIGIWYSFVITPKMSRSQLVDISEALDEGVQLPLDRRIP